MAKPKPENQDAPTEDLSQEPKPKKYKSIDPLRLSQRIDAIKSALFDVADGPDGKPIYKTKPGAVAANQEALTLLMADLKAYDDIMQKSDPNNRWVKVFAGFVGLVANIKDR